MLRQWQSEARLSDRGHGVTDAWQGLGGGEQARMDGACESASAFH